ncbi:MAG: hypothetical protein M3Y57_05225 [Acidobacteriota bacterium]|nr:hypothetical protein [Acidobacteriota bacterium]
MNLFLTVLLFSSIIPTVSVDTVDPAQFTKVLTPSVSFRADEASATRSAWVDSNGWRFLRDPEGRFYYDAPGAAAPLAAAEAFIFGVHATIHTDTAGRQLLGKMLSFLQRESGKDLPALVNIGFVDDGSAASGEFMNLLVRRSLLFRVVKQPDPKLDLNVGLGFPGYPKSEAVNPSLLAEKVRGNLTDEKRLLRIYGSELVVGRLFGNGHTARLCLINYGAAKAAVNGIRVRILGIYPKVGVVQYDAPNLHIQDVTTDATGTEFTLPELKTFAIISLSH